MTSYLLQPTEGSTDMNPERLLEHASAVQAAHDTERERERTRRELARLDRLIQAGHDHLKPVRDKLAAAPQRPRFLRAAPPHDSAVKLAHPGPPGDSETK